MLQIDISNVPAQRLSTELDGVAYTIELRQLANGLFVWLSANQEPVVSGELCEHATAIPFFPTPVMNGGRFVLLDTKGKDAPHFSGLGARWVLCYAQRGEKWQ